MISNPFIFNPVSPTQFAGRTQELVEITGMLARTPPDNIAILGARRIGKTSLLRYLGSGEAKKRYPSGLKNRKVIYVNCELLGSSTPANFWQLGETEDEELQQKLADANVTERDLRRTLREWIKDTPAKSILLLLDEFELMAQNPAFRDFFPLLRGIVQSPPYSLSLITATGRSLSTVADLAKSASSPLFNIFASLPLGKLDKDGTWDLVEKMLINTEITFSPTEHDLVYDLSWGHPYLAQVVGRLIVEGQNKGLQGGALTEWVQNEFLSSNGEAFRLTQFLLNKLTPRELEAVKLARRNRHALSGYQRQLLRDLDKRGALPIGIKYEV